MKRPEPVALRGAHVLITGGARGIGLATARRLRRAGAHLSLWDRDPAALESAAAELSAPTDTAASVHTELCDITDGGAVERALAGSVAAWGPVDVLINNAGHLAPGTVVDQEPDVWITTVDVNVSAVIRLTRLVLPAMYDRRRGHVVNISSAAGAIGVPGLAVYSASKWAVWGFTEALRAEAREHGVNVSSIHPSYIATGMFAGAELTGLGRFIVPLLPDHDRVAEAIEIDALQRGKTRIMRPRSVVLAVFLRGVLPDRAFNWLMKTLGAWDSMRSWQGRH